MNAKDIISEKEMRKLKISDEYAFRQLNEHFLLQNSRKCFIFSVMQFILGLMFMIAAVSKADDFGRGDFLKIIGSGTLIAVSALFFLYYKSELAGHQHDPVKLKIIFYIFWNIFTIGGFFISSGFYYCEKTVYTYVIFYALTLAVPVFRLGENFVAAAVYIIPCIYYGFSEKMGIVFYIAVLFTFAVFIWINAVKADYFFKSWINKKKLREASERCANISQTDNLTGMLNRTGLSARFKELYEEKHYGHRIAVIMANVDNFRSYNHKYGYDRSDSCLYNICNCIRIISKPVTDIVSRFGGDDFIIVLENMDEVEVVKFAEQIRYAVETMALPFDENGIVTISIGISSICALENEDTYSKLLNEADLQLMVAKKNGRNCIGYQGHAFIQENRRKSKN